MLDVWCIHYAAVQQNCFIMYKKVDFVVVVLILVILKHDFQKKKQ
jgi:uncharacterized membrane protein